MKIVYAICVCDEHVEIQRLVSFLLKNKKPQDKIVILFDETKNSVEVEHYLRTHSVNNEFYWYKDKFEGNFADWKNKLNSLCNGDYIFNLDADEIPNQFLIENIHQILEYNPEIDVYAVGRINTVEGITTEHIQKWGWRVSEQGWINFPDKQLRIYKNKPEIKWKNKVHEVLEGYKIISNLPFQEEWCLYHPKTIKRQEEQNSYYDAI
jgi:hypothetical protein